MTAEQRDGPAAEPPVSGVTPHDRRLLEALRAGDEVAFVSLLDRYQATLVRLARIYVPDPAIAEEVVQETWLGVLRGLDRFEGRSTLRTWIFRILIKRAQTRATREGRYVAFSSLSNPKGDTAEPTVDPGHFHPTDGSWICPPSGWDWTPEQLVLARETRDLIDEAVATLPPNQREVITLRDIEGWAPDEVCEVLGIGETNQRVLLHRARSRVRRSLERYLDDGEGATR